MPWGVAAAVVSAGVGAYSAHEAAKSQRDAAAMSNQTQRDLYGQTRTDNLPALDARNASLARLQDLLGISGNTGAAGYGSLGGSINPGDVTKDPGYQFGLLQGMQSLSNQETARGMRNSGAALMAASRFGTDYATTKYDDAFNRQLQNRQQQLNPLLSAGGLAQVGTSQIGQAGQNYANNVSANQLGIGNANAAANLSYGNIAGNAFNQLAGWYGSRAGQDSASAGQMGGAGSYNTFNENDWSGPSSGGATSYGAAGY